VNGCRQTGGIGSHALLMIGGSACRIPPTKIYTQDPWNVNKHLENEDKVMPFEDEIILSPEASQKLALIAEEHEIKRNFYGSKREEFKDAARTAARRHNARIREIGLASRWLITLPGMAE
jgi:hypothetical protein